MKKRYNIAIAGTGYVGLSNAILLAQYNDVTAVDIVQYKVDMINSRKSPIADKVIQEYLAGAELSLRPTLDPVEAYIGADFVIISTPTNYDAEVIDFDPSFVECSF